jgi:hypothetical protein
VTRTDERVVAFYDHRGTAEQHIKEGKNAITWMRLSWHAFRAPYVSKAKDWRSASECHGR